jgi:hypothetical protein
MRASSKPFVLAALLATALTAQAGAATPPPPPQNYVGIQGFALIGVHQDVIGDQHGLGAGVFVEARVGGPRIGVHLEGIPVVSVPQRPSVFYGRATPAVGIVDATVRCALDRQGRMAVGLGGLAINQRTPLPNISQVVSSRLSGVWAELLSRTATRGPHFYEANLSFAPDLRGTDHFLYSNGLPAVNKDERASAFNASLGLGTRLRAGELVVGLRAVNYSAQFTRTGDAADRNAGIGLFIEWRYLRVPAGDGASSHPAHL